MASAQGFRALSSSRARTLQNRARRFAEKRAASLISSRLTDKSRKILTAKGGGKGFGKQVINPRDLFELKASIQEFARRARVSIPVAIEAAAQVLAEEMARRAPRDTGFLEENIVHEETKRTAKLVERGVGPHKEAYYGVFHELGTFKMPANPWMVPAFDSAKRRLVNAAKIVYRRELLGG